MTIESITVNPETMKRILESRKAFFEQQVGESQVNISILTKSIETFNDPQDVAALAAEQIRYYKLVLNYTTVNELMAQ